MAVTSRPTAKKTTINFSNIAAFGGGSGVSKSNQFLNIRNSATSNIQQIDHIIAIEEQVDQLDARVTGLETFTSSIIANNEYFNNSINSIRDSIGRLESGQWAIIANAKNKEKILEKRRRLEEQRLKAKKAEEDIEGNLDDKKDGKNVKPLQKIGKKAMGILGGLGNFLKFVVAGWFTDKTFKLIEAFQTGNKEMINKIGLKLLAGTAAIGGLFLLSVGALGPVIAGVFSLIGTLASLLLNPVTLTALLIAIGVGGAIFGIKKLYDWGSKKYAGGQKYKDAHKANRDALLTAGIKKGGQSLIGAGLTDTNAFGQWRVKRDGQWKGIKYKNMTNEEKAAVDKFKAERQRIIDIKDQMNKELGEVWKTVPKTGTDSAREFGIIGHKTTFKVHSEDDKKIIAQKKAAIRAKYENMLANGESLNTGISGSNSGDGSNVGSTASTNNVSTDLGPVESTEGSISIVPMPIDNNQNLHMDGIGQGVEPLTSGNPSNIYLIDAKLQYNTYV